MVNGVAYRKLNADPAGQDAQGEGTSGFEIAKCAARGIMLHQSEDEVSDRKKEGT
jgi:hypothetical protein